MINTVLLPNSSAVMCVTNRRERSPSLRSSLSRLDDRGRDGRPSPPGADEGAPTRRAAQSGIWALSVTNDFIGNRVVNQYNGIFTQTSLFPEGRGAAAGKVCTQHAPLGTFKGNVCHSNERFGFYLDNNFPRKIKRSVASNGFRDPDDFSAWRAWDRTGSCDALTADGRDNGAVGYVEDQLEMGNSFSGQYEVGDVQVRFPLFLLRRNRPY